MKVNWYLLKDGRLVTIHKAYMDKERTESVLFAVENGVFASTAAAKMGLRPRLVVNANTAEEEQYFTDNPKLSIQKVVTV